MTGVLGGLIGSYPTPVTSSFESIATVTAAGGETSVTFSSIVSTYKHLQIRYQARKNASGIANLIFRPNGDSTNANFAHHILRGTGGTVSAAGDTGVPMYIAQFNGTDYPASGVGIIDVIDYASTTKNKTIRCFDGFDDNGTIGANSSRIELRSGLWLQTTAISSVVLYFNGDALSAGSTFSLYGIKGA